MSKEPRQLEEGEVLLKNIEIKGDHVKISEIHLRRRDRSEKAKKPRIYLFAENYNPIEDMKSGERWNKPHLQIKPLLAEVFRRLGHEIVGWTFTWNQKAGCGCGCSPGFVVGGCPTNIEIFDVWLTYSRS